MFWLLKVMFNIFINLCMAPITFIKVFNACAKRRH